MHFLVETIFGTHSATRVKDFLYLIFCSGTQRCIFLVLCYVALPVRSKDCLNSCIQSAGKTVAGRTTSRVNSMGYETTCFLSAEFICAKINKTPNSQPRLRDHLSNKRGISSSVCSLPQSWCYQRNVSVCYISCQSRNDHLGHTNLMATDFI